VSWDLEFVPGEAASDVLAWLEEEHETDAAAARAQAEAVAREVPEVAIEGPFDGGAYQLVSHRDQVPLTVDLDGCSAALNVAYWPGTTDSAAPVVERIAAALASAGPFLIFDPQDGELIDPKEVGERFRVTHRKISAITARVAASDERRRWYRERWTVLAGVLLVLVLAHRLGAF